MKVLIWIRSLISALILAPLTTFFACIVALIATMLLKNRRLTDWVCRAWARTICFYFGIRVKVVGLENFPAGGAMFLFNHTSHFDILIVYTHFPQLRFGAKLELFSIPLFGQAMRSIGTLPIARANREAAIRVLAEAEERARRGEKFILAPEGGRGTSGDLLPFKAGPFLFAIQAQVPLVPLIIRGALDIAPKGTLIPATKSWTSTVEMHVLRPVPTTGKKLEDRGELQQLVRGEMQEALTSLAKFSSR